jgi:arylsulfatase A-like enzyme
VSVDSENQYHPISLYIYTGLVFLFWEYLTGSILGIFHFEARRIFWGIIYYPFLFLLLGVIVEAINYLYSWIFPDRIWPGQRLVWLITAIITLLWGGLFHQFLIAFFHLNSIKLSYRLALLWPVVLLTIGLAANLLLSRRSKGRNSISLRTAFICFIAILIYLIISTKVTYRFFQQIDTMRYVFFNNTFAPLNLCLQPAFLLLAAGITAALYKVSRSVRSFRLSLLVVPLIAALLALKVSYIPSISVASTPPFKPPVARQTPNVIVLLFDALRADHVGLNADKYSLTPWMDELGELGKVFPSCYSTSSWTFPAVASLLTSRLPNKIGLQEAGTLPDSTTTVVDILHENGYRTGAYTANHYISEVYGFDRSFDEFQFQLGRGSYQLLLPLRTFFRAPTFLNELAYQFNFISNDYLCVTGTDLTRKAQKFIQEKNNLPFFLYLHYNEPHVPYWAMPFQGRSLDLETLHIGSWYGSEEEAPTKISGRQMFMSEILHLRYTNGIRVADKQVKRIWSTVKELGLADETIIIIVADHGEEFLEHGGFYHKSSLFQEQIRIPLIIYIPENLGVSLPDQPGGVSMLDLAPTILDLVGIEQKMPQADGQSLLQKHDSVNRDKYMMFQQSHELWSAVVAEPYKLILKQNLKTGVSDTMLFNLDLDPGETNNLRATNREICEQMLRRLQVQLDQTSPPSQAPKHNLTLLEIQRMRSLGYTN